MIGFEFIRNISTVLLFTVWFIALSLVANKYLMLLKCRKYDRMSDLIPVLEEAYDDSGHLPSDSLRQVTSTSKANTRLTAHHHKLKMHKKKMSTFEKRFAISIVSPSLCK